MESSENDLPAIPSTFTRHFGGATPALEYNTPISVCFRNGEVKDGTMDDFDFEPKHEGYASEIVGYRLRSVSVAEEQKEHPLGSLGRAFGIPYVTPQPTFRSHPMDRAEGTPKATRDNPISIDTTAYIHNSELEHCSFNMKSIVTNDYKSLSNVLDRAFQQAAHGKGRERHATGQAFEDQPMQIISQLIGSSDGLRYQAIKKIQEAGRMDKDAAVRELLGAINYIAGTIIYMEK